MVGSHLVLVTRHGQFTITIEQDKIELVTLNTIFTVVSFFNFFLGVCRNGRKA